MNYIQDYIRSIRSGEVPASREMHQACDYIEGKLNNPDVFVEDRKSVV